MSFFFFGQITINHVPCCVEYLIFTLIFTLQTWVKIKRTYHLEHKLLSGVSIRLIMSVAKKKKRVNHAIIPKSQRENYIFTHHQEKYLIYPRELAMIVKSSNKKVNVTWFKSLWVHILLYEVYTIMWLSAWYLVVNVTSR